MRDKEKEEPNDSEKQVRDKEKEEPNDSEKQVRDKENDTSILITIIALIIGFIAFLFFFAFPGDDKNGE